MKLQGKRIALFVDQLYEEREFWYPYYRLQDDGAEVVPVAAKAGIYPSKHGLEAEATCGIAEARAADFDAVVIPGGYAPDYMRRSSEMVDFVRQMAERGGVVAAICHGGWLLASAGVLKGKCVTSFFAIRDDLVNAGAEWVDKPVVRDGNLITSRKPDDLPGFCRTIITALTQQ